MEVVRTLRQALGLRRGLRHTRLRSEEKKNLPSVLCVVFTKLYKNNVLPQLSGSDKVESETGLGKFAEPSVEYFYRRTA